MDFPTIEFPYIRQRNYPLFRTSRSTGEYNCIAWALGFDDVWFEPPEGGARYPDSIYSWPDDIPDEFSAFAYIRLFEIHGFRRCKTCEAETGYVKVALWFDPTKPRRPHAARLCEDGYWTSKMGDEEDIKHDIRALMGGPYGDNIYFLKKRVAR